MTVPTAAPEDGPPLHATVEALLATASERFVDLGFLAPDGRLDRTLDLDGVRAVRVELPTDHPIQLQSLRIDATNVDDVAEIAQVHVSGQRSGPLPAIEAARLFDIDRPTGTVLDIRADRPAWVEVRFSHPVTMTRVRLRNVSAETARRARGLRVLARTRWRDREVYDSAAEVRAWRGLVRKAKGDVTSDADASALLDVLDLAVRGDYARAHTSMGHVSDEQQRRRFRTAISTGLLAARGLEWTVHGPQRPFRAWSEDERVDYVRDSAAVVEALTSLTSNVCLGFGSVLAVVRDRALIPHDDDLDIIIAFEPHEATTLADGLRRVEDHLRPLGFEVSGGFAAHRHVRRPGRKRVDVFVGLFEGESVSWYPGPRGGLTREIVFPPGTASLLGIPCTIPARAEAYLERLYGEGWRVPDPYFSHAWNLAAYADIAGTSSEGT